MSQLHTGLGAVTKFNPQLLKPEELKAVFVARQRELYRLVERIRQAPTHHAPQHVLLVGHRGMGKSTLLHRIALAVQEDPVLHVEWVTLIFPEEQYTVGSLDKFWCNAIDALCEQLELDPVYAVDVAKLDAINAQLLDISDLGQREQQAFQALKDWVTQHGKRLLLLVDSSDLLFETLAGRNKEIDQQRLWHLRELLSNDPSLFWLGCSYSELEANQDYAAPFHHFFQYCHLKPLNIEEIRQTFLSLARTFGAGRGLQGEAAEQQMQHLLHTQPERLETLIRLAGGNPRTTVVLYELLAAGGHDDVHSDLQRLLDDLSPLYKDRLESLPIQARQVFATVLEHWAPILASDIAQTAGLEVTTVNSQLSRLEAHGLIEKVNVPDTKRNAYQACERFFNIWYLMRCAPRRMRVRLTWLVEFMRLWFAPVDIQQMAKRRASQHRVGDLTTTDQLEFSRALSLCLPEDDASRLALDWTLVTQFEEVRRSLDEFFGGELMQQTFHDLGEYKSRLLKLKEQLIFINSAEDKVKSELAESIFYDCNLLLEDKEDFIQSIDVILEDENVLSQLRDLLDKKYPISDRGMIDLRGLVERGDFVTDFLGFDSLCAQIAYLRDVNLDFALFSVFLMCCRKVVDWSDVEYLLCLMDLNCVFDDRLFFNIIAYNFDGNEVQIVDFLYNKMPVDKKGFFLSVIGAACIHMDKISIANIALERAYYDTDCRYSAYFIGKLRFQVGDSRGALQWFRESVPYLIDERQYLKLVVDVFLNDEVSALKGLGDLLEIDGNLLNSRLEKSMKESIDLDMCFQIADLFSKHPRADFLRPFEMALRLAGGDQQTILTMPVEIQKLSYEVLERIQPKPKQKDKQV